MNRLSPNATITIAIADDHVVLRNGLAELVKKLGYTVVFEAGNGKELTQKLTTTQVPDIVLMDINMPEMDGFEATQWLKSHYHKVKVLALSMYDDEGAIIRMLKSGARGYVLKSSDTEELDRALRNVYSKGYHNSDIATSTLYRSVITDDQVNTIANLSEREISFLKYAATEMTYKEIADIMCVSARTVDGYREALFTKLEVKSRVGLVLCAIRNRLIYVD